MNDIAIHSMKWLFIIFIVYYFVHWIMRKSRVYALFFSGFCFLLLLRLVCNNDFLLRLMHTSFITPDVIQHTMYYLIEILCVYMLLGYTVSLLLHTIQNKLFISLSFLFLLVFIIVAGMSIQSNPRVVWMCHGFTHLIYVMNIFIILFYRTGNHGETLYLLTGFISLYAAFINYHLYSTGYISHLFINEIGITLFFLSQGVLLIHRTSPGCKNNEYTACSILEKEDKRTHTMEQQIQDLVIRNEEQILYFIDFAGEVKNTIALIRGSLLEYGKEAKRSAELKDIRDSINTLFVRVENILDTEMVEQGIMVYSKEIIINASHSLCTIINQYIGITREKKIHITYSGEDSLFLQIDPYAFYKLIDTLLYNAVINSRGKGQVDVKIMSRGEDIEITVSHNGAGIPREYLDTRFLPFSRAENNKKKIRETGLGLYMVKQIVNFYNGSIHMMSNEHNGTSVMIVLPLYTKEMGEPEENACFPEQATRGALYRISRDMYDRNKPTLFFVQNTTHLVSCIQKILGEDFNVLYAGDGNEGLEKLHKGPKPDIIISDVVMDVMDGHEFYNNLMAEEQLRDIPFIFLSTRKSRGEKLESFKKGVIDYFYTPFDKDMFIEKIKAIVKNRMAHRESEILKMEKRISSVLRKTGDDEFLSFEKKCKDYKLSPREKEVLRGILEGLQIKEIADKLYLSVHTVRNHIRHIYHKCKVQNRVELVNLFR